MPRSFLQPGLRIKLHPDDTYAYGLNRGGIDERWFASTTPTANEGRAWDEGLNYVVVGKERFTLAQAVEDLSVLQRLRELLVLGVHRLLGGDRAFVGLFDALLQRRQRLRQAHEVPDREPVAGRGGKACVGRRMGLCQCVTRCTLLLGLALHLGEASGHFLLVLRLEVEQPLQRKLEHHDVPGAAMPATISAPASATSVSRSAIACS